MRWNPEVLPHQQWRTRDERSHGYQEVGARDLRCGLGGSKRGSVQLRLRTEIVGTPPADEQ